MSRFKGLYVDGVNLREYGIELNQGNAFNAPKRVYTTVTIPGKNGTVILKNDYFENVEVEYECSIAPCRVGAQFREQLDGLRNYLLSRDGYVVIRDDYHPDEYRLGMYQGPFDVDVGARAMWGEMTLTFDCKPQRYLDSGDIDVVIQNGTSKSFKNPTHFAAKPLIESYGLGEIIVNGVTITTHAEPIDIDFEEHRAYWGDVNQNGLIGLSDEWPVLDADQETTIVNNTDGNIIIRPRWWTI